MSISAPPGEHVVADDVGVQKPADAAPEHPLLAAMKRAPRVERLPPELKAYLDQRLEEIRAGRARLVPHEEVMAGLAEAHRAEREDEP
jgi:hypothetical protein